ncbi:MAG: hypothetical protein R3C02_23165 [Planctomycetaceae bacterium]
MLSCWANGSFRKRLDRSGRLLVALGVILLLWSVVNFGTSLLAVIVRPAEHVYGRFGRSPAFHLPAVEATLLPWSLTLDNALSLQPFHCVPHLAFDRQHCRSIRSDAGRRLKSPHIVVHLAKLPNTLASVRQAIEDGTD